MVKKLQKMADKKKAAAQSGFAGLPAGLLDNAVAQNVKDSAQQIWAAGLASFNKAQGEGNKVFEALVSEGLKLQKKTQSAAEERLSAVASKVTGMAGDVGSKAGQHWDKLETIFEERVAKALKTLGVPSAGDVDSLIKRIDALAVSVGIKKASPVKAAAKTAKTATKAVVKKAAAVKKAVVAKAPAKAVKAVKTVAKKAAAKAAPVTAEVKAVAKTATRRVAKKVAPVVAAVEAKLDQAA
jgi:poly(hydroxyalkanoate) granule-associated protein